MNLSLPHPFRSATRSSVTPMTLKSLNPTLGKSLRVLAFAALLPSVLVARETLVIKAKNADGGSKTVEHTVDDLDNGSYLVTYQVDEPCSTSVDIQLFNDGIEIPLRGSPYTAEFEEVTTKNWNQLNGPFMQEFVKKQLEE